MANNYNYLFKYIIVGDSSVGKSNLLMKFAHNKFTEDYQATIGVEFGTKNIEYDNQIYRIQIWDTAGQENFRSITRAYFKNCVCAMVVYDITSSESFQNVQNWIQDIRQQSPKTVSIILIGNKIDLEDKRVINFDEGNEFAMNNGIIFGETSAKTGDGIEDIFLKSVQQIVKNINDKYYDLNSETCGIKKGNVRKNSTKKAKQNDNNKIELNSEKSKGKEEKKCC